MDCIIPTAAYKNNSTFIMRVNVIQTDMLGLNIDFVIFIFIISALNHLVKFSR